MKISLDWLKDYINLKQTPMALLEDLTLRSVEVDAIVDYSALLKNIVVGQIIEIQKHPNADKLRIVLVDIADAGISRGLTTDKIVRVVCGGSNLEVGNKVAFALPGASVRWHGSGEPVVLEPAVIRGEKSFGMICASEEIGFMKGKEAEIMVLDDKTVVGQPLAEALDLSRGVLDIDVLPNRPDLLSHVGFAREMSALYDEKFHLKDVSLPIVENNGIPLDVIVDKQKVCPRYSALVISGLKIAPSPQWLKNRLIAVGLRPINNIVDLTNYLMLDLGQPLHAFDYDKVVGQKMTVREAQSGEKVTTLDGKEWTVPQGTIIIEDAQKIIDLAGIMGGENSQIDETTQRIIFQAAVFDPLLIRKASTALGHRTDAVGYYEKGVDATRTLDVLAHGWQLLRELSSLIKLERLIDINFTEEKRQSISINASDFQKVTGMEITKKDAKNILAKLGCEVTSSRGEVMSVIPPTWRLDLSIKEDLVEEVGRIFGYENLKKNMPNVQIRQYDFHPGVFWKLELEQLLADMGFSEVINYSFIKPKYLSLLNLRIEDHFTLSNPMSEDMSVMRSELVTSLLANAGNNLKYFPQVKIFELSKVFSKQSQEEPAEIHHLAGIIAGEDSTYYSAKGALEKIMGKMGISNYAWNEVAKDSPTIGDISQQQGIYFEGRQIGTMGLVREELRKYFDIKFQAFWFDVELDSLFPHANGVVTYQSIQKFPSVHLDLAIVVDTHIAWKDIDALVVREGGQLLKHVEVFDVYSGKQIADGKKSIAFHMEFFHEERTLTMEEVMPLYEKVQLSLKSAFAAEVRELGEKK